MKDVVIYTDGSCLNNPGNGGWAGILIYAGIEKCVCGAERNTTNNRMELMAMIKSLECLKERCNVKLYSDSAYIINAFENGWLDNWESSGWKTYSHKEVQNKDLWKELREFTKIHNIEFIKVKGHSDNEYNNRCDIMARGEASKLQ